MKQECYPFGSSDVVKDKCLQKFGTEIWSFN